MNTAGNTVGDGPGLSRTRPGPGLAALGSDEIRATLSGVRVVRAEQTFAVSKDGLEQGEGGVGAAAGGLVGDGEVGAAGEGVRVGGAEDSFAVGEDGLVQGQGVGEAAVDERTLAEPLNSIVAKEVLTEADPSE